MTPSTNWSLTARWVFPVSGPPLPRGVVHIEGDRIAAVEPAGVSAADFDLGNVAILPGFTNAHTHLDLTGLHGRCPPGPDFTAWLRGVIAHRRHQTPEQIQAEIRAGLEQSLRHGVTLLGDISAGGASWDALANVPVRAVVYHELLGLPESHAATAWQEASRWLHDHPATPTCRAGLSPHAPYSVRASLFEQAAGAPPATPIAIHLAETLAEQRLLQDHEGPFVDFLRDLGVWDEQGLISSIDTLLRVFHQRRTLWVHANYLDPRLFDAITGTVVYCPRTHAAFGHPPHPWQLLRQHGVHVALGTDSLASNPDLSILEEIRFLYRMDLAINGAVLLSLATLAGAEALGRETKTGSITSGKSADLVVLPLPDRDDADPHRLILDSPLGVERVLFRGRWVWPRNSPAG